jgi:hypothetical protein
LAFILVCASALAVPLGWRGAAARWAPIDDAPASYLPALEARRVRTAFKSDPIDDLRRLQPGYVLIGDSMAGRVDPERLTAISNQFVAPLLQNATGSAYWYLVLKNYVVASGIKPQWVVIFFRDTNLTEPAWRLTGAYRPHLDDVAGEREPELDAMLMRRIHSPLFRIRQTVDRAYGAERARSWVEPALTDWPARVVAGRRRRQEFLDSVNAAFALERLRPVATADLEAAAEREMDFDANVSSSALPLMVDVAQQHGLRLVFVRVLRRTAAPGRFAPQPERMTAYVRGLRAYLGSRGVPFLDERDDPANATIRFNDGDHIAREDRVRYTDWLYAKLQQLPR